jgi:predicted  nucleic acid-binding Zn-ribbon protein
LEDFASRIAHQHANDFAELKQLWREVGDRQLATDRQIEALAASVHSLAEQQRETDRRVRDTNRHLRELGEATDKRISDLVSAIGHLVASRDQNGSRTKS